MLRYDNNDYSSFRSDDHQSMVKTSSDETGGGLRIASITNYADSNCIKMVGRETLSYLDPQTGRSSGDLYMLSQNITGIIGKQLERVMAAMLHEHLCVIPLSYHCQIFWGLVLVTVLLQ